MRQRRGISSHFARVFDESTRSGSRRTNSRIPHGCSTGGAAVSAPTATARRYVESNSVPTSTVAVTGAIGDRCRHQPKAWADAPRTEDHADHGRRLVHRVERPGTQHSTQQVEMRGDIEHWKCHLDVEHSGGFRVARPTQHDHLVWALTVRISLRQSAVLGEADPAGSGKGPEASGFHPG